MRHLLNRPGLNGKLIVAVVGSVIAAVAVLTVLIIRRETALLAADGKKSAEVLATTISTALRDNMLSGRTDDTMRLMRELSAIPGVDDIAVLAIDGRRAFEQPGDFPDLGSEAIYRMHNGQETTVSTADAFYLIKPLWNERACRFCHPGTDAIRGAVAVKLSTAQIAENISDLIKRMAGFGAAAAVLLSSLLILLGRGTIVRPLRGLTDAARRISGGEYVLYLASDEKLHYDRQHIEFFQLLSEVISSGIFNSRLYDDMERSYLQTVGALANAVEAKDPYTRGHSERVANLSAAMAEVLGLSRQEKEHLRFAALLHDVGKIGINRDIIRKDCRLDECEEKEMRSHPDKGAQILAPIHFLKPALPAIRHHHENFDGTGYPAGLKGGDIPFKARILSVADAWDAMLSDRPYRKALSDVEVKAEMLRRAEIQFDPQVVEALFRSLLG